jgi:hypothetical protein
VAAPLELITNGGFEQGFTGWSATTTLSSPLCAWSVGPVGPCLGDPPATDGGSNYASNGFDGNGPGTYTLAQTVTIPAGTATLSWEDDFQATYGGTSRTTEVRILDASGTTTLGTVYSYAVPFFAFTGWVQHSVDVSGFAGQTVQVAFVQTIPQTFTGPAGMGIDNVSLLADPAASGARVGYCSAAGDTWADGSPIAPGTFLDLLDGQPSTDPHYSGATFAIFVEGRGLTCDAPPVGYKRHGAAVPYADYSP